MSLLQEKHKCVYLWKKVTESDYWFSVPYEIHSTAIGESDYWFSVPYEIHSTAIGESDYWFSVPYEIHSTAIGDKWKRTKCGYLNFSLILCSTFVVCNDKHLCQGNWFVWCKNKWRPWSVRSKFLANQNSTCHKNIR